MEAQRLKNKHVKNEKRFTLLPWIVYFCQSRPTKDLQYRKQKVITIIRKRVIIILIIIIVVK